MVIFGAKIQIFVFENKCSSLRSQYCKIRLFGCISTVIFCRSCYTTGNAMAACLSTVLSGKRKREADFVDETPRLVLENGETVDFRDYIKASRVNYNTKKLHFFSKLCF